MKRIGVLMAMLAMSPLAVQAQTTTSPLAVTATVSAALNASQVAPLDFGAFAANSVSTVAHGDPGVGIMQVDYSSTAVSVVVTEPANLVHTNTVTTMGATYTCGWSTSATSDAGVTGVACGALPNGPTNGTPGTQISNYIQVAGAATAAVGQLPGVYSGSFSMQVTAVY